MTELLTADGYEQTKAKLARLEERLAALSRRQDVSPRHATEARGSYEAMIAQYRREIKLYEAAHHLPAAS